MTLKIEAEDNFKEALRQKEIALAQQKEAEHQRSVADEQRGRAEEQRQRADKERETAEEQRQIAQEQEREALRAEGAGRVGPHAGGAGADRGREPAHLRRPAEGPRRDAARARRRPPRPRRGACGCSPSPAASPSRRRGSSKDEQRELAALLAAQAYRLHEKNGGSPDDAQLFEALRAALARLAPETAGVLRSPPGRRPRPRARAVPAGSWRPGATTAPCASSASTPLGKGSRLVATLGSEVRALAWIDGGKRLAAGTLDGRIWLLDAAARRRHVPVRRRRRLAPA